MTSKFVFWYRGSSIEYEDLMEYKPRGFHPVILGEILPKAGTCVNDETRQPRYRILQKLGFGSFSTVWLARDLVEERYIALKVCQGSDKVVQSNEGRTLRELHQIGRGKPGSEHVIEIYDDFTIRGPNGLHECIVTEVILPLEGISAPEDFPRRRLVRQLLRGFAFIHEEGLVHGDPHYANFGIALPQLQELDEKTLMKHFSTPTIIPVLPRDPAFPRDSVPIYITKEVDFNLFVSLAQCFPPSDEVCLKILDFGRGTPTTFSEWPDKILIREPLLAYWESQVDRELPMHAPFHIRPPEGHMHLLSKGKTGSVWSREADIWAVGCTAFKIQARGTLFRRERNLESQLYHTLRFGGPLPEDWSEYWDLGTFCERSKELCDPWSPVIKLERAWKSCWTCEMPERELFLDLIRKMVVTVPDRRTAIAQLLYHPFFSADGPL